MKIIIIIMPKTVLQKLQILVIPVLENPALLHPYLFVLGLLVSFLDNITT